MERSGIVVGAKICMQKEQALVQPTWVYFVKYWSEWKDRGAGKVVKRTKSYKSWEVWQDSDIVVKAVVSILTGIEFIWEEEYHYQIIIQSQ